MNKTQKLTCILSILLFVILSFALFLPFKNLRVIISLFLLVFAIFTCHFLKKRNLLSINKRQVFLLMLVSAILYVAIYYISGLAFGYNYSAYRISFNLLFDIILPISIIVIAIENIRSVLLAQKNKVVNVFIFLTCLIVDVLIYANLTEIKSFNIFMDLVGLNLIPAITSNVLYQHVNKKYGIYSVVVFRLIITLFVYLMPIVPSTPDALYAFYKFVYPLAIYLFVTALFDKKVKLAKEKQSKVAWTISSAVMVTIMVLTIMLISNQFKYGILVVGSESMSGEINKGDAIIFERYDDQIIKEGQVIVFKKADSTVIHRVVDITNVNGQVRYYTKGDANDSLDSGYILSNQIIGITNFKISYIGYPTIWINDIFTK